LRYQSGLGTNDLLLGLTYGTERLTTAGTELWQFTLGYQQPFGTSGNNIDSLRRGPDLVGGISYSTLISDISLSGEILAIKRLTESKLVYHGLYTTEESPDPVYVEELTIPNSAFFQLNLKVIAGYAISSSLVIDGSFALPLLKREDNTDGLKRVYTFSGGLRMRI
jgi:hypothetical protein